MASPRLALGPVGIWTAALDVVPLGHAKELAAELESLGYDAVWLPEVAGRDVFVHLGALLDATTRLVGVTGIANIFARDAVAMAGAANALTEAFPERVLVGLGVSHAHLVEGLRGHTYDKPLTAMAAYLDAMDASPYTAQRPTTPVRRVLGALGPKMLRLAGDRTDGAHPYLVTPEHTEQARAILGDDPLLCPEQMVLVEADPDRARTVARANLAPYLAAPNYQASLARLGWDDADLADGGSDKLVDALVAWGDVDAVASRVQAHFDAGADHVAVQALPPGRRQVPVDQWRALAPALTALRTT